MVSTLEARDHEVDVVGAEVVWSAKLHRERDLPERYGALSGEDAPELCIIRLEISLSKFKGRQAAVKQDVDGTAPSTSTLSNQTLLMQGSRMWGNRPGFGIATHQFARLKEIARWDQAGSLG
jgi:hypothetical protein